MAIKMPHVVKNEAADKRAQEFISGAKALDAESGKAVVNMRIDVALLKRIDEAARKQGISRTAWLCVAASKALE